MWSCDGCGIANHHDRLICETCGAAAPGATADEVSMALRRDLAMESHLRALSFWYRVGAVLFGATLLGLLALVGGALFGALASLHGSAALWAGAVGYVAMFTIAAAAGSYLIGHYLGRFANGARIAAGVTSLVALALSIVRFVLACMVYARIAAAFDDAGSSFARPSLAAPIAMLILSALWSGAIAVTLLSGRAAAVCAPAYRTIVARTARMKASLVKTPFFVVPLAVTIVMALMLLRAIMALRGW